MKMMEVMIRQIAVAAMMIMTSSAQEPKPDLAVGFTKSARALDSCDRGSNQRRQWGPLNCRSCVGDLSTCYESTSGPQASQASPPTFSKSIAALAFSIF